MKPYFWNRYSHLVVERILNPRNIGAFKDNAGTMQEMRVVIGLAGKIEENGMVRLSLVIDTTDGIIADAKFQAYGSSALISAADVACEVILRKNYDQAKRLTSEIIDRKLRDFKDIPAFPKESAIYLDIVLEAIKNAAEKCEDIPLLNPELTSPIPSDQTKTEGYPQWESLNTEEKLSLIHETIQEEIQPYIELDAGGIEVTAFNNDQEIVIAYQGACTTCPSATGTTLEAIQSILRSKLSSSLQVKADLDLLNY